MGNSRETGRCVEYRHLVQTPTFWFSLVGPILLGVCLGSIIYFNSPVGGFCFEPNCISFFLELYRLPIALAGLALPFVAMIASLHRSKEAFLQIQVGQAQYSEALKNNKFGNFLKHRDGFFDVIDRFIKEESDDYFDIKIDQATLYSAIFPRNNFENLCFIGEGRHWDSLENSISDFESELAKFSSDEKDFSKLLKSYISCISGLHFSLKKAIWYALVIGDEEKLYVELPTGIAKGALLFSLSRKVFSLHERIRNFMGLESGEYHEVFLDMKLHSYLQESSYMLKPFQD